MEVRWANQTTGIGIARGALGSSTTHTGLDRDDYTHIIHARRRFSGHATSDRDKTRATTGLNRRGDVGAQTGRRFAVRRIGGGRRIADLPPPAAGMRQTWSSSTRRTDASRKGPGGGDT